MVWMLKFFDDLGKGPCKLVGNEEHANKDNLFCHDIFALPIWMNQETVELQFVEIKTRLDNPKY